jgi:hypothetical protein
MRVVLEDIRGVGKLAHRLTLWAGLIPLLVLVCINDVGNLYLSL